MRAIDDRLTAGDYQVALRLATDLHERATRRHGSESIDLARVEDRLVAALVKNGKGGTAEALRTAEHAIGVKEAALGRDHVETTRAMHNLALVRLERGEFNDALALHTRALEIRRRVRADDKSVADSLDLVALSLIRLKRFDAAEKYLAEALPIREAHAVEAPLALAQTLEFVGLMHRMSGRLADAGPPVERSLSLRRQHAPGHPDVAAALEILGDLRFLAGDTAGASRIWSEAREHRRALARPGSCRGRSVVEPAGTGGGRGRKPAAGAYAPRAGARASASDGLHPAIPTRPSS